MRFVAGRPLSRVMTRLEIDLSRIETAHDIHALFSEALGFPGWYGHNWDAFWDLISSEHPLPEQLIIRGLEQVERNLPWEAEKMLACFEEYNNSSGRVCRVRVTDDYDTRMFFLSYEARPTKRAAEQDVLGAFINCWIKADSAGAANQIALRMIKADGWEVVSPEKVTPVTVDLAQEEEDSLIRQACVDGVVFQYHTWSSEDDQDE